MRYYIAYKFLDSEKGSLKSVLTLISSAIEETGNKTFIFFRDAQQWGKIQIPANQVIINAFEELKKCDGFFAFVESDEKSEGLLLEAGYAKALDKRIVLAIKKGINLRFLRAIANEVIEFDNLDELKEKIKETLY